MVDALTGTDESLLDTTAYNLAVYYEFRASAIFDSFAEVRATKQSHRGVTVTFTSVDDMAIDDTALDEYTDPDAVALSDAQISVTLTEFGRATISTAKLRGTSFIEFDPTVANRLAYNAARSVDLRAQNALLANTAGDLGLTGQLSSDTIREAFAQLQENNVPQYPDGYYRCVLSPRHAQQIKAEVGDSGWRLPMTYGGPTMQIYRGEIGIYEGFRFIVNTGLVVTDTSPTVTRPVFFLGREALAKAFSSAPGFGPYPTVRPGPVTDKLWRFRPMGWYWLGQYRHFRDESSLWASLDDVAPA